MTTSPTDALLFDVPPPPTPVERLLHLADQYTQHNDALDLRPLADDAARDARHLRTAAGRRHPVRHHGNPKRTAL
ncbi:hypothetical protein [Streptomyces sp. NPDC002221]|uniref:hypothetical protein n=1 Tax=Streptomyces sp. NPDC002221 TaxID=3364639 RepID=UPI0036831FD4